MAEAVVPVPLRPAQPPVLHDARGQARRVGIELEFMGPPVRTAAEALQARLGGTLRREDAHAYTLAGSAVGDLAIELDMRHLHPQRHGGRLPINPGPRAAAALGWLMGGIVPRELIAAPMPIAAIGGLDRAVAVLREAGAWGEGATAFGSLGLHFNIAAPDLTVGAVLRVFKAFLLLAPWLQRETRGTRHRPQRYPADFVREVIRPNYRPDLATFIDDYLTANPTRDRGLDLLPLLLHLDHDRVRARLPREKILARPVYHYRLPQAFVSDPNWSVVPDWNRWVAVERLAQEEERMTALAEAAAAEV